MGGATWATAGREDRAEGREGKRRAKGGRRGAWRPRNRRSMRCCASPGASSRCRRTTPTTSLPPFIYNINPNLNSLIPPGPPQLPRQLLPRLHGDAPHDPTPAVRGPRAQPTRMAAAPAARGPSVEPTLMAAAPVAQEPRAEPAREAVGVPRPAEARSDLVQAWDAVPESLGGETLPLMLRVYGLLNWTTSEYMRNRPFDAGLLQREGGSRKVLPGGWVAREDHERVLQAMMRARWPDREPVWPAILDGRGCSASWTPRPMSGCPRPCALPSSTGATAQGTRHRRSPRPHTSGGAGDGGTHGR